VNVIEKDDGNNTGTKTVQERTKEKSTGWDNGKK
jgi:hypothetical protein